MAKFESFSRRPEFKKLPLKEKVAIAVFTGHTVKHARTSRDWIVDVTSIEVRRNVKGGRKLEMVVSGSIPYNQQDGNQRSVFALSNILNEFDAEDAAIKHGGRKKSYYHIREELRDENKNAVSIGAIDVLHIAERQKELLKRRAGGQEPKS